MLRDCERAVARLVATPIDVLIQCFNDRHKYRAELTVAVLVGREKAHAVLLVFERRLKNRPEGVVAAGNVVLADE